VTLRPRLLWSMPDLKSYFDTISKDKLLALVAGKVPDRRVLALVEAFLGQRVLGRRPLPATASITKLPPDPCICKGRLAIVLPS
jgi:hypothetical protein